MTHAAARRLLPYLQNTLLLAAFMLLLFCLTSPVMADVPTEERDARDALVKGMATNVLSILHDHNKPNADRESVLKQGFANVVDIDWIAKFVLGNAWRTASEEQKQRYTELYRNYLTGVYVSNYAQSSERKITDIKVVGIRNADEDDKFTAQTELVLSGANNVKVDYLVSKKGNGYKIVDVVIEGVSLLASHRSEFGGLAAAKGVDGVIGRLEQLASPARSFAFSMK